MGIENLTPLHKISEFGREEDARVLLGPGVDANARDFNNASPLYLVSRVGGSIDVVRSLLRYSSDIHARDDEGQTPFMRAAAAENHAVMELLLEHGAEDHRMG